MSEEQKNYLLCISEPWLQVFKSMMPGLSFVEVRGMDLTDNKEMRALVTPIPAPVEVKSDGV